MASEDYYKRIRKIYHSIISWTIILGVIATAYIAGRDKGRTEGYQKARTEALKHK